jgi:hypothetical protein
MKSNEAITVYCASSTLIDKSYNEAAKKLGQLIGRSGHALVTGAGKMGLMGSVNSGAIEAGGETIGVIPQFMVERGWHHTGLTRLEVVADMHQRKELMAKLAMGVIALPGGCGTFEELLEIITWRQLGLWDGNIVILNLQGYYDNLIAMFETAIDRRFMKPDHRELYHVATTPEEAIELALRPVQHRDFSLKF